MSDDEREARIRALLPMVKQIARRVHRMVPSSDLDDLVGDGSVGLIRAVDGFDATRGVPLEHYARRLILGAVLNGVRRMDPVAERMRRTIRLAEKARFALAHELGMLPTMRAMEVLSPELAHARIEAHRRIPLSLDTPLPRGERLEPDHAGDPQCWSARGSNASASASPSPSCRRASAASWWPTTSARCRCARSSSR